MSVEEYRPAWCPHVVGRFERKVDEEGKPEAIRVDLECDECGELARATCESGAPRQWVLRFAQAHVHRDPLNDQFPKQGGQR